MRILLCLLMAAVLPAQEPLAKHMLEGKLYPAEENEAAVKKFQGLRVTDVADGLQVAGLQDVTVMDAGIGPMWKDEKDFSHRIYGVAVTLRLVPAQDRTPNFKSRAEFDEWKKQWTQKWLPKGFAAHFKPNTVLVIDASRTKDVGFCGSANAFNWMSMGLRGIVIDGGCRDTDEMVLERIPVYQRDSTRGINQGRIAIESYNAAVNVGGVLVLPGDIVVADADGVVVVPRAKVDVVAEAARSIQDGDKQGRRKLYEKMKRVPDFTVR